MLSLPEYAVEEVDKILAERKSTNERCLFLVGSKNCGKTSSIYKFLDMNEKPNATLSLEYFYSRKTNHKEVSQKLLCHIWEFSGKRESIPRIFPAILRENFTVLLFLDLSKPKYLWDNLECCLNVLKDVRSQIQILVVGAKYDIFKEFDQTTKKAVCTSLRSVALHLNAPLIFTSNQEPALSKRLKDVMSYYGFNQGSMPKEKTTNINKPICLFNDNWDANGGEKKLHKIKSDLNATITQEIELFLSNNEDLRKEIYPEPDIDAAIKRKLDEIKMSAIGNEALQDILRQTKI